MIHAASTAWVSIQQIQVQDAQTPCANHMEQCLVTKKNWRNCQTNYKLNNQSYCFNLISFVRRREMGLAKNDWHFRVFGWAVLGANRAEARLPLLVGDHGRDIISHNLSSLQR